MKKMRKHIFWPVELYPTGWSASLVRFCLNISHCLQNQFLDIPALRNFKRSLVN